MAHICPFCSNETAGADPCPWCGASMGVAQEKPKRLSPIIIHDDQETSPWPIAAAVFVILVLAVLIFEHNKTSQEVAQLGSTSGPSLLVNNHSPLFQSPSGSAPQLAHITSLKSDPPPSPTKSTEAKDDPADDTTDDGTDDPIDLPTITSPGPESVQLSDVQLASQDDGVGHEISVGSATIYNPSQYEITGYQLYVATAGGTYRLMPFSGSVDSPTSLESTTIGPGARITVPIMSNGVISVSDSNAAKTVTVEASENGVTVSSHVIVD